MAICMKNAKSASKTNNTLYSFYFMAKADRRMNAGVCSNCRRRFVLRVKVTSSVPSSRSIDILNKDCRRSISAILTWVPENVKISARPLNNKGN